MSEKERDASEKLVIVQEINNDIRGSYCIVKCGSEQLDIRDGRL